MNIRSTVLNLLSLEAWRAHFCQSLYNPSRLTLISLVALQEPSREVAVTRPPTTVYLQALKVSLNN